METLRRIQRISRQIVVPWGCVALLGLFAGAAAADELRMISVGPGAIHGLPKNLTPAGDDLYFTAYDWITGSDRLYKTDGTQAGTIRLTADIDCSATTDMLYANGTLFFNASVNLGMGAVGRELFASDGTAGGTGLLKDINPGPSPANSSPTEFIAFNNKLFFQASDGHSDLWKSDGTVAGTVKAFEMNGVDNSEPADITPMGYFLIFSAYEHYLENHGRELYGFIEIPAETGTGEIIKDINPGTASSSPENLTYVNGVAFFSAHDGVNGRELWKTNGTTDGTQMVKDINTTGSSVLADFVALNNRLLFTVENGDELWRSDGTEAGTYRVRETYVAGSSNISHLAVHGNYVYFRASNGLTTDLWRSNGSILGTIRMTQPQAGGYGYNPEDIISCNNRLFFTGFHLSTGREIWENDGTSIDSGTTLVANVNPTTTSSNPDNLTCVGDKLYFTADDGSSGTELWVFDMSSSGGSSSFPWTMFLPAISRGE